VKYLIQLRRLCLEVKQIQTQGGYLSGEYPMFDVAFMFVALKNPLGTKVTFWLNKTKGAK